MIDERAASRTKILFSVTKSGSQLWGIAYDGMIIVYDIQDVADVSKASKMNRLRTSLACASFVSQAEHRAVDRRSTTTHCTSNWRRHIRSMAAGRAYVVHALRIATPQATAPLSEDCRALAQIVALKQWITRAPLHRTVARK